MNNRQKAEFEIIAAKMDARQEVIDLADQMIKDGQKIPKNLQHVIPFIKETPWREDRKVYNKVIQAAKKAAKAKRKRG